MILAKAKIGEYDRFESVFTSEGAEQRRKFGSQGAQLFRSTDDPNEVWVLFDWARKDWKRFMSDPGTAKIMRSAGLQGPPEEIIVEAGPRIDA